MNKLTTIVIGGSVLAFGVYFLVRGSAEVSVIPAEQGPTVSVSEPKPAPSETKETPKAQPKPPANIKGIPAPAPTSNPNQPVAINTPVVVVVPPTIPKLNPGGVACNTSLINANGFDSNNVISREACDLLNRLYLEGKVAGNIGDTYENRDGLHVNLCDGWTPNPECPLAYRLFPQHAWQLSGGTGRAIGIRPGVTIGQASYSGETSGWVKHSIAYTFYKIENGANLLYDQYTNNNLYIYPSLEESKKDNIGNTPYVISSEYFAKDGGSYYANPASGSDLPFVKIAMLGLAAFKPDVKETLKNSSFLMPTLQMLIRNSHRSVNSESDYLTSVAHDNTYRAHYLSGGSPLPNYNSAKLVRLASGLTIVDIPPLAKMKVLSEDFTADEKLFNTLGAIGRRASAASFPRTIIVSAEDSVDIAGNKLNHVYEWRVLKGSSSNIKIIPDASAPSKATIEFTGGGAGERLEVGVFIKKQNGTYYSVPGIISVYARS